MAQAFRFSLTLEASVQEYAILGPPYRHLSRTLGWSMCLKEHRAQLMDTVEHFHATYDVCLRQPYGLNRLK
jgi:hypothetical protein